MLASFFYCVLVSSRVTTVRCLHKLGDLLALTDLPYPLQCPLSDKKTNQQTNRTNPGRENTSTGKGADYGQGVVLARDPRFLRSFLGFPEASESDVLNRRSYESSLTVPTEHENHSAKSSPRHLPCKIWDTAEKPT